MLVHKVKQVCGLYLSSVYMLPILLIWRIGLQALCLHTTLSAATDAAYSGSTMIQRIFTESLSPYMKLAANQAQTYPSFCSMNWLRVFLFPPPLDGMTAHSSIPFHPPHI